MMDTLEFKDIAIEEVKLASSDAAMTFSGYGAVFNNIDAFGDKIAPGAFADNLAEWKRKGKKPKMLLDHGAFGMSAEDNLPIGGWTSLAEDGQGLRVEGKLLDTTRGVDVYKAMKAGELDGLSIGYIAKESVPRIKPDDPRRTLKKIHLIEVSVVTFPANARALVHSVKSWADQIQTIRQFEDFLRDVGKFSHARAKAIASRGWPFDPRDEDGARTGLADALRRSIAILQPS